MVEQAHQLRAQLGNESHPDALAQAIACAAPIIAAAQLERSQALSWLEQQLADWERFALREAIVLSTRYSVLFRSHHERSPSPPPPPAHLYEPFLQHYSKTSRKRHGVFFTPQPIADYIVAQIDHLLRDQFDLSDGLASQSKIQNPKSKILLLDPACGTGVFLLAAMDLIHRSLMAGWINDDCDESACRVRWNSFVPDLLSRLTGIEILPAAAFLTKLNITLKLAETGYDFQSPCRLNIITGDALSLDLQSRIQNPKSNILPIVLGNPPFSSLSINSNDWITRLVRGDDEVRGYVRANGQVLGERKTWLHDDYVKFIRLAQWHIEQAGCGIVGFVTNHGYLDNATFRLMRHELLRVFPRISIVDLHGNRKKHEVAPDGSRDESVFGLDQGVAIGIFCSPLPLGEGGRRPGEGLVEYADLWGLRDAKLAALLDLSPVPLFPIAPGYRFVPAALAAAHPGYDSAWSLADAMPINTTAPVTARDHFVVAFTEAELRQRIGEFRDLSIPDDEIRRRYFQRTRSARYEIGDTRSWKMKEARRIVAADTNWQRHILRCLYRPFDWRYVFWHPAMIDWPRTEVTRHLLTPAPSPQPRAPLCLIARRQQLPTQPCTFFWISDGLALDGVIRSDNRGSESLFPLYLTLNLEPGTLNSSPNFAPAFIEQFTSATNLPWQPLGRGALDQTFGPEDLLAYIYALFHSPSYRERYADRLRSDFPRVLMPKDATQFRLLCGFGHELIDLHLLRGSSLQNPKSKIQNPPPPAVAAFRAGGYVALRKWLQPKHRSAADSDYSRISAALTRTIEIMHAIDAAHA